MAKRIENIIQGKSFPTLARLDARPLDDSEYFKKSLVDGVEVSGLEMASRYAKYSPIAYVGQILIVDESNNDIPETHLYKIADTAGTLKPIYDADNISTAPIDSVGFKGELPPAGETLAPKSGYQYALNRDITNGPIPVAQAGDYLVFKPSDVSSLEIPADNNWTPAAQANWIILEQNLTNAVTLITGGDLQPNKYVKSIVQNGHVVIVTTDTLPTIPTVYDWAIHNLYFKVTDDTEYKYGNIQKDDDSYYIDLSDAPSYEKYEAIIASLVKEEDLSRKISVKLNGVELEMRLQADDNKGDCWIDETLLQENAVRIRFDPVDYPLDASESVFATSLITVSFVVPLGL